jgi:outer membrane protein assembly factor BamB
MTRRRSFLATVGALTVGSLAGCLGNITEQWVFQTGGEVASSPAVVDGTVYVVSLDGTVYALTEQ